MKNILDRIAQIADNENTTITALEHKIGASKGVLSRALANNTDIQSKWVIKIVDNYPLYDAKWLLTGKGKMKRIENDFVSKEIEPSIPFYSDITSIGGTALAANNKAEGVEYINPGDWFPGATAAIRHYGESMQEYPSGCILVLKEIKDLLHGFIFGQNYVLEYGEDWNRVTKRVQKNGKLLMAYSTNLDTYPDGTLIHQPFEIIKIHRAWRIVGCIIKMESSNGIISVHK